MKYIARDISTTTERFSVLERFLTIQNQQLTSFRRNYYNVDNTIYFASMHTFEWEGNFIVLFSLINYGSCIIVQLC